MRFTAAAVQFEPRFGEKAWNVERLTELVEQAARAGARLIVLPEMATTGYFFHTRAEIAPFVEQIPEGPTVAHFIRVAARHRVYIVVCMPEVEAATGAYYNTAVLVGPYGYIGQYRKAHSYTTETLWARDGDLGIPVFQTELGRVAMLICMDANYPEPFRVAALGGADVIALPTNWMGGQEPWMARAMENGFYVVASNRWGEERGTKFCGHAQIIDPAGAQLNLLSTGDGLAMAEIDTERARTARARALSVRRPGEYQGLLISSHLWHWQEVQGARPGRMTVVAAGQGSDPSRLPDQVRWADRQARDRGWPRLDLAVMPFYDEAPDLDAVLELAASLGCYIAWGFRGEEGHNEALLVGPNGPVGRYCQVHAEDGAVPGDGGFSVFDLPFGRIGLLIGQDLLIPEAVRLIAKRGADLIAAPVRRAVAADHLIWRMGELDNNTPIIAAAGDGGSRLYFEGAPRQQELVKDVIVGRVDTGAPAVRSKEMLRKLQPRWYTPLVLEK